MSFTLKRLSARSLSPSSLLLVPLESARANCAPLGGWARGLKYHALLGVCMCVRSRAISFPGGSSNWTEWEMPLFYVLFAGFVCAIARLYCVSNCAARIVFFISDDDNKAITEVCRIILTFNGEAATAILWNIEDGFVFIITTGIDGVLLFLLWTLQNK